MFSRVTWYRRSVVRAVHKAVTLASCTLTGSSTNQVGATKLYQNI